MLSVSVPSFMLCFRRSCSLRCLIQHTRSLVTHTKSTVSTNQLLVRPGAVTTAEGFCELRCTLNMFKAPDFTDRYDRTSFKQSVVDLSDPNQSFRQEPFA